MAKMPLVISISFLSLLFGDANGREIAGWVEQARLEPSGIELKAKLDTGAKTSSVTASEMEFFTRNGTEYVRFKVENRVGETVDLELPVVRRVSIKRHFGESQQRPVVKLTICIGSVRKEAEVNLVDRTGFNYALLIGRTYLAGDFLVDPGETRRLKPHCGREASP